MGFGPPGRVEGVPARGEGLELDDLSGPFQAKLFCDSSILCYSDLQQCSNSMLELCWISG